LFWPWLDWPLWPPDGALEPERWLPFELLPLELLPLELLPLELLPLALSVTSVLDAVGFCSGVDSTGDEDSVVFDIIVDAKNHDSRHNDLLWLYTTRRKERAPPKSILF
jgi:hypothetical protein